jgi:hypothetical protein
MAVQGESSPNQEASMIPTTVFRWRRSGEIRLEVMPVATPGGGRLRLDVRNRGHKALESPRADVRPAPLGVEPDALASVVPPDEATRGPLAARVEPGHQTAWEVACPLRPGPLYRRVLALDPDDEEPVYGLPIETLLWIEVRWRERGLFGWRQRVRRLVRGRYRDTDTA